MKDFDLTMTITESFLGVDEEIELVKDGGNTPLTNENKIFYI